jgi:hypothetical protein
MKPHDTRNISLINSVKPILALLASYLPLRQGQIAFVFEIYPELDDIE